MTSRTYFWLLHLKSKKCRCRFPSQSVPQLKLVGEKRRNYHLFVSQSVCKVSARQSQFITVTLHRDFPGKSSRPVPSSSGGVCEGAVGPWLQRNVLQFLLSCQARAKALLCHRHVRLPFPELTPVWADQGCHLLPRREMASASSRPGIARRAGAEHGDFPPLEERAGLQQKEAPEYIKVIPFGSSCAPKRSP